MDKKLVDLAKRAGVPVNDVGGAYTFSVMEKIGIIGSNELELDSKIEKLADLLFDDFVNQWWVKRHGVQIEKP